MQQLQQNELTTLQSSTYIVAVKANSKFQKAAALEYQAQLIADRNSSIISGQKEKYKPNTFLKHHLGVKCFSPENFQAHFNLDNFYNTQNASEKFGYSFADLKIQKSLVKRKIDFSFLVSNIFDVKAYNDLTYSINSLASSSYLIRGRTVMFNAGFQFWLINFVRLSPSLKRYCSPYNHLMGKLVK